MSALRWVQLSGDEREAFLGDGGTGVLAFQPEDDVPPAAFPVSYGYSPESDDFYFRLSFPPGSRKRDLLARPVTFVTYAETAEGYRSVVASGNLAAIEDLSYDSATVQAMWAIDIPTVDVFDRPIEEVPFHDFYLDPETLTGRKEVR